MSGNVRLESWARGDDPPVAWGSEAVSGRRDQDPHTHHISITEPLNGQWAPLISMQSTFTRVTNAATVKTDHNSRLHSTSLPHFQFIARHGKCHVGPLCRTNTAYSYSPWVNFVSGAHLSTRTPKITALQLCGLCTIFAPCHGQAVNWGRVLLRKSPLPRITWSKKVGEFSQQIFIFRVLHFFHSAACLSNKAVFSNTWILDILKTNKKKYTIFWIF